MDAEPPPLAFPFALPGKSGDVPSENATKSDCEVVEEIVVRIKIGSLFLVFRENPVQAGDKNKKSRAIRFEAAFL